MTKLFTDLANAWTEQRYGYKLKCGSIFLDILNELAHMNIMKTKNAETFTNMEHITVYIRKHCHEQISVDYLASLSGYSACHFRNIFKKHTGLRPIDYINSVKIQKAAEYISTGYSVGQAASMLNFSDPFYFSKVFKKFTGKNPKEYRKSPLYIADQDT